MTLAAVFVLLEEFASAFRMNRDLEIYVGNISTSVSKEDLKAAFKDYTVNNFRLLTAGAKKYAFLELDSESSLVRALREMNGHGLKGKKLVVRAGNHDIHQRLTKEIECGDGPRRQYQNRQDEGPPPLESYSFNVDPESDCPPPLEPAFQEDSLPPLEEVFTKRLGSELPQPEFQQGRTKEASTDGNTPITLVVANFPFGTTEEDLLWVFKKFSPLKATVILNTRLKDEITYAYVTLPDTKLAEQAIQERDDYVLKNRNLIVTYVLERVHHF